MCSSDLGKGIKEKQQDHRRANNQIDFTLDLCGVLCRKEVRCKGNDLITIAIYNSMDFIIKFLRTFYIRDFTRSEERREVKN